MTKMRECLENGETGTAVDMIGAATKTDLVAAEVEVVAGEESQEEDTSSGAGIRRGALLGPIREVVSLLIRVRTLALVGSDEARYQDRNIQVIILIIVHLFHYL